MSTNRNASASLFGWNFQVNAAIVLMLKNIKDAKKIKIEGELEDVEITLNTEKVIYAQAKSSEKIYPPNDPSDKLKKAIKTLNDASKKGNHEKLIYITNYPNPFAGKQNKDDLGKVISRRFKELHQTHQNKINTIVKKHKYQIDLDKFYVQVILFYGDDENERSSSVKEVVREFLGELDKIPTRYTALSALNLWQIKFGHNATVRYKEITKDNMMWYLIADICTFDDTCEILEDCDEAEIGDLERRYNDFISSKTHDFQFANRVIQEFNSFHLELRLRERENRFIEEKYALFLHEFDIHEIDEKTKTILTKIILKKIINYRSLINQIKQRSNLACR
jgi:hypothetical protein